MSQSEDTTSDLENVSRTSLLREEPSQLRRLAPRALPPQSTYDPALLSARYRRGLTWDGRCEVCFRRGCSLSSHRLHTQSKRGQLLDTTRQSPSLPHDAAFSSSYATIVSTWFTDEETGSRWNFELPISRDLDQSRMRRLFKDWFVVQAPNLLTIPKPIEIVNDLLHSPFLQPALNDALLCHSILAVSATMQMRLSESDGRVLAHTLFDQSMALLRRRVAQDTSQLDANAMAAAIYLWHANLSLAADDSLEGHARSIGVLIEARGGVESLGMHGAVANLLRWTEVLYSIRTQSRCRYMNSFAEEMMDGEDTSSPHGASWRQGSNSRIPISNERVIQACQDCNHIIAALEVNEPASMDPAEYQYLCQKACHLLQQSSEIRATYFENGSLEECIILTIDLLKVLVVMGGYEQANRWDVRLLCTCIVGAVRSTGSANFWQNHTDLFIWIMFVVRVAEHDSAAQEWCKRVLRGALESKLGDHRSWTAQTQLNLQALLVSFGWSNAVFSRSIEHICRRLFE